MNLRLKSAAFIGTVLGSFAVAMIISTSELSAVIWYIFGIAAGWVSRSYAESN